MLYCNSVARFIRCSGCFFPPRRATRADPPPRRQDMLTTPATVVCKKTFQRHSSMVVRVSSWMLGGVFDLTMTSHSHERSKLLLCASLLRIVFCIYFTSLLPSIILSLVLVYAFVGLINKPISYLSVYSQLNSNMVMSEFNLLPMKFLETRARAYKNI